jgi:hypothetical protein
MKEVPDRINGAWVASLTDEEILGVEGALHETFSALEFREKKARGDRYNLMRSPADLMEAWNRWSLVNAATRARSLNPHKRL